MRKIRDALRLRANGLSMREIAASLGVGQSTLSDYLKRAARAGLVWPLPEALTDAALEAMLFQPMGGATRRVHAQPDWPTIHRELRRKDVTLALLWEEYRAAHPDGYGYSRFCDLYRRWEGRLAPTMRQHHVAGERMFVDYAGATLAVIDAGTDAVRQAHGPARSGREDASGADGGNPRRHDPRRSMDGNLRQPAAARGALYRLQQARPHLRRPGRGPSKASDGRETDSHGAARERRGRRAGYRRQREDRGVGGRDEK